MGTVPIQRDFSNGPILDRLLLGITQQYDELGDDFSLRLGASHQKLQILLEHLVNIILGVQLMQHLVDNRNQLSTTGLENSHSLLQNSPQALLQHNRKDLD